jgi:hypothetical protein
MEKTYTPLAAPWIVADAQVSLARDDVSTLLRVCSDGDQRALARLTRIVYNELHVWRTIR